MLARQRTLLYNTTLLGVGAAVLSTAIGAPLIALARVPLKRKAAIRVVLAAPMLLPPYVVALAWIYLWTSGGFLAALVDRDVVASWTHSLPAAILVLSLVFYPLRCSQANGFDESTVVSRSRLLWRSTAPDGSHCQRTGKSSQRRSSSSCSPYQSLVPGLLRVRVYTTEIFTAFAALYDFSRAIVLAVPLLVLSAAVGAVAAQLLGDRIVSARRLTGRHPALFDHWRREARSRSPW